MRTLIALLILISLCAAIPVMRAEAANNIAEDLSGKCAYRGSMTVHKARLTDDDFESAQRINQGEWISVEWDDTVPASSVMLSFYFDPVAYTVSQYDADGNILSEEEGTLLWNNLFVLEPTARKIRFRADADNFAICSLYVYGDGEVPDYHPFQPTPEKADYMLIAMHPDDDVLFLGAIIPTYGMQLGYEGVAVYMGTRMRIRRQEALNGAWTMGLRTLPVFGGFPDIPEDYYDRFKNTFTVNDVIRYTVTILRKYRPEVVITQDLNGEYGHWQHKILAQGVLEAVSLTNDPSYQPAGYPAYEPWEVKKLYLHLYPENRIELDVDEPIDGLDGKTAFEAAVEAFAYHRSQQPSRHSVSNEGIYSLRDFGLAYSTVGSDTQGVNDMFEHILTDSVSLKATPEPSPTVFQTPKPTAVPQTDEAYQTTPIAVETEKVSLIVNTPEPDKTQERGHSGRYLFLIPAVLILAAIPVVIYSHRKRR